MISFREWIARPLKQKKKKKDEKYEQRGDQTNGESGYSNQQGKVERSDSQVSKQTIHIFPVPDQR
jgi:hypothetical protein